MRRKGSICLIVVASLWLAGCGGPDSSEPATSDSMRLAVSIAPQGYFARRIAGERAVVDVLVAPGQNPHTYQPTARQMIRLGESQAYFTLDLPFERVLVAKIAAQHPKLRVVDTTGEDHAPHADHGNHDHGHHDPHTWLSPRRAADQARVMCDTLCRIDEAHADRYRRNLAALAADLDRLDAEIAEILAPVAGGTFYVFHPAFGHFAQAYDLKQMAIEAGGKDPTARRIDELIRAARAQGVRAIFVGPQFSRRMAGVIARQIGAEVVVLDPLADDYPNNLRDIATKIRAALAGPKHP